MKKQNKTKILLTILFGIILLIEIIVGHFFPNLAFVSGNLTIAYRVVGYLAFSSFVLCISILFNVDKMLIIPLGIILFLIFVINSCAEIYPIDTTTKPIDISVLRTNKDGSKLIVQERINAKTNRIIIDTVLVKDNLIFRQIIETRKQTTKH